MKKADIINVLLCILFKVIIELIYVHVLRIRYDYMGLYLDYNVIKNIESYILMIVLYKMLDKNTSKPSSIIMIIIYILSIIPLMSLYGLKNESRATFYLSLATFVLTIIITRTFPRIKLYKVKFSKFIYLMLIITFTIFSYSLLLKDNGLPSLSTFNFNLTYEFRSTVIYNSITSYLVPWQAQVINTFLIAVFYLKKEYKKMLIPVIMQLILYMFTAHKLFLFSPLVIIGLFYIIERKNLIKTLLFGLISLNIMAYLMYLLKISLWPIGLLTHRQHFIPAQIGYYFFDFFSKNEKLLFSEGLIGKVFGISSPYSTSAFNLIGDVYFNRIDMHANTWYIADAYANGGIIGLLIIGVLLSFTLLFIDSITKNYKVTIAAIFMPALSLTNGSLLTVYFTNGLLIGILIILLYSNFSVDDKIENMK